ncbi:MAG: T9SS type A sorting domain-containing protein [Candidatus Eiseniibacteriota bacterium]|nr:MAG: T9SS type A sorting domain-containing protein [Candidatus Eisenbacteria bacterium]
MRTAVIGIACLFVCLVAYAPCSADVGVWHRRVIRDNVNMRGAPVVLAQQIITVAEAGNVVVQFDGQCWSSPGDRIILAASKTPLWYSNDGHTEMEAYDSDINIRSFSHTRVYPVSAGTHTFYAVGENFVETAGSGIASVYGSLVVKFFPDGVDVPLVSHTGIVVDYEDVRGASTLIAQRNITVGVSGNALVRFDGVCVSTPGDRIILAASNTTSWSGNDGCTAVEAIDSDLDTTPFSHSRMYSIGPGSHDFYAVAENIVETDGDGIASFYGSLTVEFFPTSAGDAFVQHTGVSQTNVYVRGAPVVMDSLIISPTELGTAIVRYEGLCVSDVGDRIIVAASDKRDWESNDGNVGVEAVSADLEFNSFSHTQAYNIAAGSHTFYGVCENYVETAGSGIASNYASLSVEFFPGMVIAVDEQGPMSAPFALKQNYPNPFNPLTHITFSVAVPGLVELRVYDVFGRPVRTLLEGWREAQHYDVAWDGRDDSGKAVASGVYFYQLEGPGYKESKKMVLLK